jgi:hypothetical protein
MPTLPQTLDRLEQVHPSSRDTDRTFEMDALEVYSSLTLPQTG